MSQLQERTLNIILLGVIVLLAITELGFGDPPQGTYHSEIYIVQPGDTLWTIAETYIQKNTYGPREIREFYYGIIEGNWPLFEGRQPGAIYPGDKLTITWWEKGGASCPDTQE